MKKKFKEYLRQIGITNVYYSGKEKIMYISSDLDMIRVASYVSLYPETLPFKVKLN